MKRGVFVLCVLFVLFVSSASATHTKVRSSSLVPRTAINIDVSTLAPTYSIPSRLDLSLALYRCMDSDGGVNPLVRGTVLRIPLRLSEACMDWAAGFEQQCPPDPIFCRSNPSTCAAILYYCSTVELPEECFGQTRTDFCLSSRQLREYYCSGSNIRYRDVACSTTCSSGSCTEAKKR